MDLKSRFIELCSRYCPDNESILKCWNEIEKCYSDSKRHYHNLEHIRAMLVQAEEMKTKINNFDVFCFSIFYHDVIYKVSKSDNEEKSAELAANHLFLLKVSSKDITTCREQIIATKNHLKSDDMDTNLFLDIDMSILGSEPIVYADYANNVRKEFQIYPSFLYKKGRKKVLNGMLKQTSIYHTTYYREHYEKKARLNIQNEINSI